MTLLKVIIIIIIYNIIYTYTYLLGYLGLVGGAVVLHYIICYL